MRFSYDPQRLKEYARKNPGWNERVREQAALGFPRDPRNYRPAEPGENSDLGLLTNHRDLDRIDVSKYMVLDDEDQQIADMSEWALEAHIAIQMVE